MSNTCNFPYVDKSFRDRGYNLVSLSHYPSCLINGAALKGSNRYHFNFTHQLDEDEVLVLFLGGCGSTQNFVLCGKDILYQIRGSVSPPVSPSNSPKRKREEISDSEDEIDDTETCKSQLHFVRLYKSPSINIDFGEFDNLKNIQTSSDCINGSPLSDEILNHIQNMCNKSTAINDNEKIVPYNDVGLEMKSLIPYNVKLEIEPCYPHTRLYISRDEETPLKIYNIDQIINLENEISEEFNNVSKVSYGGVSLSNYDLIRGIYLYSKKVLSNTISAADVLRMYKGTIYNENE